MVRAAYTVILAVFAVAATPATPAPTPPPQIYRVVSRPLCSELHEHIAPAIGMMLQNDTTIKKSPELFKQYNMASLYGSDPATAADPRQRACPATPAAALESGAEHGAALDGKPRYVRSPTTSSPYRRCSTRRNCFTAAAAPKTTSSSKPFAISSSTRWPRRMPRSISSAASSTRSRWPICSIAAKNTSAP